MRPATRSLLPGLVACLLGAAMTVGAMVLPEANEVTGTVSPSPGLATDPVCGMTVLDDTAETVEFNGVRYSFCAASCRQRFLAAPEQFDRLRSNSH